MEDKLLLKAAGILGIIFGALASLTIVGLIIGIPMIIGGYNLYNYSSMGDEEILNYKNSIFGWSIFFCIFSIIPGVLGLIYYFGLTNEGFTFTKKDHINDLEKLKKLYDDRAITKEEYEAKKKEILDKI